MLNDAEWTRELLGLSVIAPVVRIDFSQKERQQTHSRPTSEREEGRERGKARQNSA